jgi:rhomboid protease GluP
MEQAGQQEGVWQYKATWRSSLGFLTGITLFVTGVVMVAAIGASLVPLWLVAALFAWVTWFIGRPIFRRDWVLRIGPRGVSGYMLNGRTIPWRDVRDIGVETVQGISIVVLTLAPDATDSLQKTRRRLSGRKPERRIALNAMRTADIPDALAALNTAFVERAGSQAAAAAEVREKESKFEAAFVQELMRLTPNPWALYLVVSLNIGVWLWNVLSGVSPMSPSSADLFRWGANSAWAVARDHEYWRLLTATFLHGGLIHLAMNMLGLWSAGKLLNRLYGNGQFLLVYFASALVGSAASLHFGAQASVSVGASGAVFGVLGALIVAARRYREQLPKALNRHIMTSEGVFLVYALLNGFAREGIDNAAHVGGLLAGAAMTGVLASVLAPKAAGARGVRAAAITTGVVAAVAGLVLSTSSARVDHGKLFAATAALERVSSRFQAANAAFQEDLKASAAGRLTEQQFVERAKWVHLAAFRDAQSELARVPRAHGDPRAEAIADLSQFIARSIEGMELLLRIQRGDSGPDAEKRMESLKQELQAIARRQQERQVSAKKSR